MKSKIFLVVILGFSYVTSVEAAGFEYKNSYQVQSQKSQNAHEYDVVKDGDRLYISRPLTNTRDIEVVDISDADNPIFLANIDGTNLADTGFFTYGVNKGLLYVMSGAELIIYEVSDPKNPIEQQRISVGVDRGVATFIGSYMYIRSSSSQKLSIFDISNPTNITLLGEIDDNATTMLKGQGRVMARSGDYLFVTSDSHSIRVGSQSALDETGGVDVYDVSDPSEPQHIRTYPGQNHYLKFHDGNYDSTNRYVIDGDLHMARVAFNSDGTMSVIQGDKFANESLFASPRDFYVNGTTAYIPWGISGNVSGINGVRIYDIASLDNVRQLRFESDHQHEPLFSTNGIFAEGNIAYVITYQQPDAPNSADSIEIFSLGDQLYRFYSEVFRGHFFTTSIDERDSIIANDPNWRYEGIAYETVSSGDSASLPVFRFWSENFKHHFYTISDKEKESLIANDPNWQFEGNAYSAYPSEESETMPVYRFWSENYKGHFYTASLAERESIELNDPNWRYEGIAWWVR